MITDVVRTARTEDLAVWGKHLASLGCRNLFIFSDGPGALYWRFRKPEGEQEYCFIDHCGQVLAVRDYENN
ncbi:MAG: hypothetical protein U0822_11000 [Anaerolineae bacterium]